ncbi:hypothetical protein AMTRI_Chr09g16240 [Amborella trichopoda]|uniref:Legume lectin domain-containing protein n=1 Tax=Amborella trichopoda TaxID=13333 RepID=W1NLY4_AMBTC|nr:uncharacterized protein LOC18424465 [Amborella trichopoda]ERM96531.1 hypothetical protein AMTR_s00001p00266140 [Amborella trichopoda]|eukprot:XP_006829115.1 uncharacterized protein LOC18424465 [Amborella trichopoda]
MAKPTNALLCWALVFVLFLRHLVAEEEQPSIDELLQRYAFRAFGRHPKTALIHPVPLPANMSGIDASAVRFRSGSLRRYGANLSEFSIRRGGVIRPYVRRIVLVRQNLGDRSPQFFNLTGFTLVSPIVGLLVYDASDLNATNPRALELEATGEPISVTFGGEAEAAMCVFFDSQGVMRFLNRSRGGECLTLREGHVGLVVMAPPSPSRGRGWSSTWKVVVGSSVGGLLGTVLLGFLLVALLKFKKRSMIAEMERRAYEEEALNVSMVGHLRAPTATVTRTMPTIENDYVPQN